MRSDQRGFALLVVLWFAVAVATLAAGLATTARIEARRVANVQASAEARALIDAGLVLAVLGVMDKDPERRLAADGRTVERHWAGARIRLTLNGEAGRIDLNTAKPELLTSLFEAAGAGNGEAAEASRAIIARRGATAPAPPGGPNPIPPGFIPPGFVQPGFPPPTGPGAGPSLAVGPGAGPSAGPRRPFLSVDELASLPDLAPEIRARVAEALSVDSPAGRLDASTASPLALAAQPRLSASDREAVLAQRGGRAPLDRGLIQRLNAAGVGWGDITMIGPSVLTVRVRVDTAAGASAEAEAVLLVLQPPDPVAFRVLEWRERR